MKYLLGIDLGTSGTKTVLFREDGSALAQETRFPSRKTAGRSRTPGTGGTRRSKPSAGWSNKAA